jgi:phosphomannomutase
VDRLQDIARMTAAVRAAPPTALLGAAATVQDRLPEVDVLTVRTARARVVIRPSGTEPKLKAYLEVVEPVERDGAAAARTRAGVALRRLRAETAGLLGVPA